jgi:hypothetical protein
MPARAVRIPRTVQQLRQLIAFHLQTLRRSDLKGERSLADGGRTLAWAGSLSRISHAVSRPLCSTASWHATSPDRRSRGRDGRSVVPPYTVDVLGAQAHEQLARATTTKLEPPTSTPPRNVSRLRRGTDRRADAATARERAIAP